MEWSPGIILRLRNGWSGGRFDAAYPTDGQQLHTFRVVKEVRPTYLVLQRYPWPDTERVSIQQVETWWKEGWLVVDVEGVVMEEEAV